MMFRTSLALALSLIPLAGLAEEARYPFENGYPTAEASARAREDHLLQTALVAYRFWYPTVSAEGIFDGNRSLGIEDGKAWGYAAAGPRQVALTLNSDTPYGYGVLDLSEGPWVIELPPGPFIGLVDDHNQGWVLDMGLPGPDAGKGGKHLILPPGYDGPVPEGYFVGRSNTLKNLFALRALPVGGDVQKALDSFKAVKVYPLSQAADPKPLAAVDTTADAMDASSLRWEDNIGFWQELAKVIGAEPLVPAYLPMYGLLAELGIEKGKPFAPTEAMTALLTQAASARAATRCSSRPSTATAPTGWPGPTATGNGPASSPAAPSSRRRGASTSTPATAGSPRRSSRRPRCSAATPARARSTGSAPATRPAPSSTAARPTSWRSRSRCRASCSGR